MQKVWKRLPQWLRDTLMFILIMGCAVAVCELLSVCYDDNNPFATSVFILAVVLVSRFTTGYWPGILASAVGVVSVNYLFTYPFHEFNLTIDGYPLTFAVMLVVSVLVSTLTTQIKRQEQLRYEAERDRMRANLLRSVSHDIRTPLTAIMGLSATVEESETLTDEGRGMLYVPFLNYADGNLDAVREMLREPSAVPGLSDGGAHCGIICDASFPTYLLTHWTRDRSRGEKLSIPFVVAAQSRSLRASFCHASPGSCASA